jgi:tetratricopeptide (TPR) repeat protein
MKQLTLYFNKQRLLLLLVVAVFYGNTLKNGYALDDSIVTEKGNLTTQGISAIPKIMRSFYVNSSADYQFDYRPLIKVSYAVEHELFGLNPGISHFFNLLLYLTGLFLLLRVLTLLLTGYHKDVPFYCVFLFAIMPIHTEVVASLKNRDVLLCFLFCMLSLKYFILFFESGLKKWVSCFLSLVCYYLALLCKYDALPYLAIIPVIVSVKYPSSLKWLLLYGALFFMAFVLIKLTRRGLLDKAAAKRGYYYFENPLYFEKEFKYRLIAAFNSLGFYINQIVFPYKSCCYYGQETIPVLKLSAHGYLGIISTPFLVWGLVKAYFKKNYLLFTGLFMFCASISMYLNLATPVVGIVGDRFAFFASLGVALVSIAAILQFYSLNSSPSTALKLLGGFIIVVFTTMTIKRNAEWHNLYTLIDADVNKYPNNAFVNYKMGLNLVKRASDQNSRLSTDQRKQKFTEARMYLERSVAIDPNYPASQNYLSYVLVYLLNDFNAALPHINKSLGLQKTTELYFYKAICMRETKHKDSAEFYLNTCIQMDDRYYNAYGLLMYDFNANKEFQKSLDLFNRALAKGIETAEIYNGLGKTYFQMGNTNEAKKYYQRSLAVDPNNAEASSMVKQL